MSPRGRGRGGGKNAYRLERDREREALEDRFEDLLEEDGTLADACTARGARSEPFHRWLSYRQGFAPELVRHFLDTAGVVDGPILDPFNGSGTVTTECARAGRFAVGTEAAPGLAIVSGAPWAISPEAPLPEPGDGDLPDHWARAGTASERAVLLLAAAESVDGEGHPRKDLAPLPTRLTELGAVVSEDSADPLTIPRGVVRGDARRLPFSDGVVGGVLTSPPYVSRYDYSRVNAPLDRLVGHGKRRGRRSQMRAARATGGRGAADAPHPAAEEAARHLDAEGRDREATLVRGYFGDLDRVLGQLFRVTRAGAPVWIVIGGADLKRVLVPSDLIAAELGSDQGFAIDGVTQARFLKNRGHALGSKREVRPRESIVRLRRPH